MDSKLEKSKKTLILLGTIFNIVAGCLLLTIIALMLFTAQQIFIDITTIATIVFFNLGLLCYLAALLVKVLFGREDKTNYEKLAFDKLITDYDNGNLPKDVWRVVEYYEKIIQSESLLQKMRATKLLESHSIYAGYLKGKPNSDEYATMLRVNRKEQSTQKLQNRRCMK